jgi:hypothetical protein
MLLVFPWCFIRVLFRVFVYSIINPIIEHTIQDGVMKLEYGSIYMLTEDIEVYPKRIEDARLFCGRKGQEVQLIKHDCGLCIVRNVGESLKYWVDDSQLTSAKQ